MRRGPATTSAPRPSTSPAAPPRSKKIAHVLQRDPVTGLVVPDSVTYCVPGPQHYEPQFSILPGYGGPSALLLGKWKKEAAPDLRRRRRPPPGAGLAASAKVVYEEQEECEERLQGIVTNLPDSIGTCWLCCVHRPHTHIHTHVPRVVCPQGPRSASDA